jgi:ATP-binding cassette subfamily C protein
MKETKILEKDSFFTNNLFNYANIITETQKKALLIHDSPKHILEFLFLLIGVIFIYYLSLTNQDLKFYFPIIGVYLLASIRLLPSISFIITSLNKVAGLYSSANILYEDFKNFSTEKKYDAKRSNNNLVNINSIRMEDLSFSYKNSKDKIFEKINFDIKKNECIGIIGDSGSGKTTFVDILLGLLKPSGGKIYLNDKLLPENFSLSGNIAYLPQEPLVLEESIKTNISLEKEENKIDEKKISQSVKRANLENVILRLPNGLNTLIGKNGVRLSGGQNKRVALARTFYHGKEFIIVDEATSSLDKNAENFIAEEIKNIKGKVTIIIISHSKNIIKYCDKIYEVKNKTISIK